MVKVPRQRRGDTARAPKRAAKATKIGAQPVEARALQGDDRAPLGDSAGRAAVD